MKKLMPKVLLVTASVIVATLLAELFLTLFYPIDYRMPPSRLRRSPWFNTIHRPSSIPGLAYELIPNQNVFTLATDVKTNSYGMRDDEPMPRTAGLVRILALGDSYTFGFFVAQHELWPRVLEEKLNTLLAGSKHHFNVLNLADGGYSTRDEALVLRYKGLGWNPDLVIVGYVLNDPETDPWEPLPSYFTKPALWQYSNVCRLLAREYKRFNFRRIGHGNYSRYLNAPDRAPWKTVLRAFHEIGEIAREHGFPVLVIIFPDPPLNCPPDHFLEKIYTQVADAATQNGLHVMKLSEALKGRDYADLRVSPQDNHPNSLCHRLVAEAVAQFLVEKQEEFFPR